MVENGRLKLDDVDVRDLTFQELLAQGYVEYLDVIEAVSVNVVIAASPIDVISEEEKRIANQLLYTRSIPGSDEWNRADIELRSVKRYTHCAYDTSTFTSLQAADIPLALHNYMERIVGQAGKELQRVLSPNVHALDATVGTSHTLIYPNIAISQSMLATVTPRMTDGGQMLCIGFMTLSNENNNDAIIVKRQAIERGALRSIKRYNIAVPYVESGDKHRTAATGMLHKPSIYHVDHLDRDGLPIIGSLVHNGDVLVGLITSDGVDASYVFTETNSATVNRVYRRKMGETSYIIVHLSEIVAVSEGHKIVKSWGQKTTVAVLMDEWDMPSGDGITPDVVFSTVAIPGRGTIAWILEILSNIIAAYTGNYQCIATGTEIDFDAMYGILRSNGCTDYGSKMMYSGMTGELIKGRIFSGPSPLQVSIHKTEFKKMMVGHGGHSVTTGEPLKGRSTPGGMSLKAPEQALISHLTGGAEYVSTEASSNVHKEVTCYNCGNTQIIYRVKSNIATGERVSVPICELCQSDDIRIVNKNGMTQYKSNVIAITGIAERTLMPGRTLADIQYRPTEEELMPIHYPQVSQGPIRTSDIIVNRTGNVRGPGMTAPRKKKQPQRTVQKI